MSGFGRSRRRVSPLDKLTGLSNHPHGRRPPLRRYLLSVPRPRLVFSPPLRRHGWLKWGRTKSRKGETARWFASRGSSGAFPRGCWSSLSLYPSSCKNRGHVGGAFAGQTGLIIGYALVCSLVVNDFVKVALIADYQNTTTPALDR